MTKRAGNRNSKSLLRYIQLLAHSAKRYRIHFCGRQSQNILARLFCVLSAAAPGSTAPSAIPVWARERCRISPPRFLAECCKRQLNQGSFVLLYFRLFRHTFSDLYWVCLSVLSCTVLFVSISQMIGCKDRLRNDLYCVEWGVNLYSNQPTATPPRRPIVLCLCYVHGYLVCDTPLLPPCVLHCESKNKTPNSWP